MPVRLLNYVAELFKIYLEPEKRKMYSSSLIQIPAPEFYVFYDGDFSNHYKLLRKQGLDIDEAVRDTIRYCIDNNVMKDYLLHNESEVINMFGFEWNEKEEREALLEAGEARGRINSARRLLTKGTVTMQALKASGCYSNEELAAIAKPL